MGQVKALTSVNDLPFHSPILEKTWFLLPLMNNYKPICTKRKVNWHHMVHAWHILCLFSYLIIFRVDLQLMEKTHQQVSFLWPFVYTILEFTQNVAFTIWIVGAMDHTIQCWILVEFEETKF
jgi:hypothetical protein